MNKELLNKVIEYAEQHPEKHDQAYWTNMNSQEHKVKKQIDEVINCGTTGCLAGLGAFLYAPVGTVYMREKLILPDSESITDYEQYGQKLFELTPEEADFLFHGGRTLTEIKKFVNEEGYYKEAMSYYMDQEYLEY